MRGVIDHEYTIFVSQRLNFYKRKGFDAVVNIHEHSLGSTDFSNALKLVVEL